MKSRLSTETGKGQEDIENPDIALVEPDHNVYFDALKESGVAILEEEKCRMKKEITIADLSRKVGNDMESQSMCEKTDMHWMLLIIVSIYYSLPTLQLVFDESYDYDSTGYQDHGFLNQLCQKPLGKIGRAHV